MPKIAILTKRGTINRHWSGNPILFDKVSEARSWCMEGEKPIVWDARTMADR